MRTKLTLLMGLLWAGGLPGAFAEGFSLDDVASSPAPQASRARAPAASASPAGGVKVNLMADLDFVTTVPAGEGDLAAATSGFQQNHAAILLKALYNGDQASMIVDALHPDSYFELGLNASFFGTGFTRIPVLGTSSWRFGRILVPFGDFEFHHLYGGYVDESGTLFNKLWSDLGVSWKVTLADGVEAETMVGNGFGSAGNNPSFQPASFDNNLGKSVVERVRWTPTPAGYVLVSGYWDPWGKNDQPGSWLYMLGLDVGNKFGPLGLKAGGFLNQNFGALPKDYLRYAWYTEAKWTFDSSWAVRARGGLMNPDTRVRDATDQWDANLALLWYSGPLAVEVLYSYNQEVYSPGITTEPNNYHQLLVKLLLTI